MTAFNKIFFLAFATAVLVCSCTAEIANEAPEGNRSIRFSAAAYVPSTKASFTDDSFNVSAWTATGNQLYFSNAEVSKVGSYWCTSDDYFWPKTDNLYFVATHGEILGGQWASVSDDGTTLSTAGTVTVSPFLASDAQARLLYSDRILGDRTASCVPIEFRNALAAVTSKVRVRKCNDAVIEESNGSHLFRSYDVWDSVYVQMSRDQHWEGSKEQIAQRIQDSLASKPTYYVVPFGFSPNGAPLPGSKDTYPVKVKLKKPINHIWNVTVQYIGATGVATQGSLSMTLGSDNKWQADSVWNVANSIEYHKDTVFLYSYVKDGESQGTPVPANLQDWDCDFASGYCVIPQKLNWSPSSSINNQKANVRVRIQDYTADLNADGIFDYRDVYQHWVVNKTNSKDTVLIARKADITGHKESDGYSFYKWYEWDGTGSLKLKALHDIVLSSFPGNPSLTYSKLIEDAGVYLDYEVKSNIDLDLIPGARKCWGINTMTTYNIHINPMTEEISFDPQVSAWVDLGNVNTAK